MRPPRSDDGWYEAEQPLFHGAVEELQRLKRRARARWLPILLIAIALTAAFFWQRSQKIKIHEAQVVLSVTEASVAQRQPPVPLPELHEYVMDFLLTDAALDTIVQAHDLSPLRHKMGEEFAIGELRDTLDIQIIRNYFLYQYDMDSPRTARIAIVYPDPDPELAWAIVHEVANLIIEGQRKRNLDMAAEMSREAKVALDFAREDAAPLEEEVARANIALARAERDDDPQAPLLRVENNQLRAKLFQQDARIASLTAQADADQTVAAMVTAGLAMQFDVAEEEKPHDDGPPPLYFQLILAGIFFFLALPTVAIFVGAFDTRVHDREDVERIGLPVLGHLPSFPGDGVGSLRARGVRRRRVPS